MIEEYEGHGYAHLDKEVELYNRIEAFLDKNLKNAPVPATAEPPKS